MGAIRLLSDNLINRIAAGEVVERPASVLKELIENSLDAGADRLEVEAEAGGRRLIRVADNGCGLGPDDLLLAVERHATSKLSEETDLLRIGTLGFRGEALPSIGAVSRMTVVTADEEGGRGRRLRMSGGRVMGVDEVGRNRGTTVEVADLFFNVPARRKFLKSENTEAAHLLETAQRFALGRPELRLVYRHDGQELLETSPREDAPTRLARVLGRDAAEAMFPFSGRSGEVELSGFLGHPGFERARTSHLHLYVGGRPVRDRLLVRAVLEAYRGRLPGGRYPAAVVFLEIDPGLVDVNVHPAKAEVRFRRPNEVYAAAVEIMTQALSETPRPRAALRTGTTPGRSPSLSWGADFDFAPPPRAAETSSWSVEPLPPPAPISGLEPENLAAPPEKDFAPVGQLYRSYILAQGRDGLYIVDQHAAHERVLYERLKADLAQGRLPGQALLLPETLELPPTKAVLLEELLGELDRFGFDLAPFGDHTFVLRAVPAVLAGQDARRVIGEITDRARETRPAEGLAWFEEALLSSLACHGALKAGRTLSLEEMGRLLEDLGRTKVPTHCPHGRPLVFRLDRREIEKRFKRV
ncbi:MAG: DNA mismatch repair endonuclease MutL [Thermodesulfobacteriota bacterium]